MQKFHSHGKLLLSGEYVVLDGATALALPTKPGQSLQVKEIQEPKIFWRSIDYAGKEWFQKTFLVEDIFSKKAPDFLPQEEVSKMLFKIFSLAAEMNPNHFKKDSGYEITTKTEFPAQWGLGTSSTLVANISWWCKIDAYKLLEATFGGSGYDIAVALEGAPITFERKRSNKSILRTSFNPPFKDNLFFVHLNQKQNSRESIKHYRAQKKSALNTAVEKISALTHSMITCTELSQFELVMEVHENIISQLVGLRKVKSRLFSDYPGGVKSLGGWGGDFVLVTGSDTDMDYFRRKGYSTILPYADIIL